MVGMRGLVPKKQAKRPTTHYDEENIDVELYEEIGRIVAATPGQSIDYAKLSALLNRPVKDIQANLRYQRARLAIALLPLAQKHLMEFTGRYFALHDIAVAELERRLLNREIRESMSHVELNQTIGVIQRRMELVDKFVGVAPLPEKIIEYEHPQTTAAKVLELIQAMHQVKHAVHGAEEAQVVEAEDDEEGDEEGIKEAGA